MATGDQLVCQPLAGSELVSMAVFVTMRPTTKVQQKFLFHPEKLILLFMTQAVYG